MKHNIDEICKKIEVIAQKAEELKELSSKSEESLTTWERSMKWQLFDEIIQMCTEVIMEKEK